MSNSKMVDYVKYSPNNSGKRSHKIDRITPHCAVGQLSIETLGDMFSKSSTDASSNYGIGADGRIGMYVPEDMVSWCSSNQPNDNRAVTIECASALKSPYKMKDDVYKTLVRLCVDICRRNGKTKLIWISDKDSALSYQPADNEMLITVHRWFARKSCPGKWLFDRLGKLAEEVNKQIEPKKIYRIQAGAFKKSANAVNLMTRLRKAGYKDAFTKYDGGFYHVQVGAFNKRANAEKMLRKMQADGFTGIIK